MSCESLDSLDRSDRSSHQSPWGSKASSGTSPLARNCDIRSESHRSRSSRNSLPFGCLSDYSMVDSDISPRMGTSPMGGSSAPSFFPDARRRSPGTSPMGGSSTPSFFPDARRRSPGTSPMGGSTAPSFFPDARRRSPGTSPMGGSSAPSFFPDARRRSPGTSPMGGSSSAPSFFPGALRRSGGGSKSPTAGSGTSTAGFSLEAHDGPLFRSLPPELVKEVISLPDGENESGEEAVGHGGSKNSWATPDSRNSQIGSSYDVTKFVTMATSQGDSRQNIGRDVSRAHMQKFALCRREACAWVRRGEVLVKHPLRRTDGGHFSTLKEMRRKPHVLLSRRKKYTFVVLDRHKTASGHPELRWGRDLGRAVSMQAKGCLVLSEVHYVAATVLHDEAEVSEKLLNEFQIVGSNYSMKIVAPSRESMKLWVVGLLQLSQLARKRNLKFKRTTVDDVLWNSIVREFQRLDKDGSGDISTEELADLIPSASGNSSAVSEMLSKFDVDGNGTLQLQEFARLFQALSVKDVLSPWFLKYACHVTTDLGLQTKGISEASFLEFLEREQCETGAAGVVFADLQSPHVVSVGGRLHLTELGLSFLLCSAKNPAFDPARGQKVHQDMTQPISHYWISSSHNTYLERDQLFGTSALEQYQDVLLRGCRCVEIDCWDGDDGEPIVTHGYTATSRLMFQDVVRVCRDYGFVASPYPLILSLEVHCGPKQLARMGRILNEILGDRLLRLPEGGLSTAELVSPAAAMRRVIVKGKVPHELILANSEFAEATQLTSASSSFAKGRSQSSVISNSSQLEPYSCDSLPSTPSRRRRVLESLKQCLHMLSQMHGRPTNKFHHDFQLPVECHEANEPTSLGERRRVNFGATEDAPAAEALRPPALDLDDSPLESPPVSSPPSPSWHGEASQGEFSFDVYSAQERPSQRSGSNSLAATRAAKPASSARSLLRRLARGKDGVDAFDIEGVQEYARTLYLVARKPPRGGLWSSLAEEEPRKDHELVLFPCNIMSLNEKKAEKLLVTNLNRSREHHQNNLSRVYPMATRTSSSNPDPVPFWLAGVQMVALNYQSMDLPVLINDGLFRNENGGAGYILKPDLPPPPLQKGGCVLDVGVLCGQYLPKPGADRGGDKGNKTTNPMVRVSISGLDEDRKKFVTSQVFENGFNPRWEETVSFELLHPTLSILIFEVVHTRNPAAHSPSQFGCLGGKKSTRRRKPRSWQNVFVGAGRRCRSLSRSSQRQGRSATVATACSRRRAEEVVAAAAVPVSGLREGLRWVQLLDTRFHPVERSGLLLDIRLSGAWASERRSVSTSAAPTTSLIAVPTRAPPAGSSSALQRRCISLGASPLPQKERIVTPCVSLAREMVVAV
ncbi:unnamed protein product [Prorocentrum cordatum]|uniref:Phosphoinositide phospholipase C n=1 Tax=Prorocentrum cordatum TaxID=2364126 RepID=A0ABN9R7I6_9DINO|nr:unnamed protein product [Polarella glacialis]